MTRKEFQEVCKFLGETPSHIRLLVGALSEEARRWKPSRQDFSILEHVCHLRDLEQEGYRVRIERLLREDAPFLPDVDGDRLAQERDYNRQSLDLALNGFSQAREENLRTLLDTPLDRLERTGVLENVGSISLGKLLLMMLKHDEEHIHDLSELCSRVRPDFQRHR